MSASERLSKLIESEVALTPAAKLRLSLQMADDGIAMMRQNLRRRHPDESEAQIDQRLADWLLETPSPEPWGRFAPERFPNP